MLKVKNLVIVALLFKISFILFLNVNFDSVLVGISKKGKHFQQTVLYKDSESKIGFAHWGAC